MKKFWEKLAWYFVDQESELTRALKQPVAVIFGDYREYPKWYSSTVRIYDILFANCEDFDLRSAAGFHSLHSSFT